MEESKIILDKNLLNNILNKGGVIAFVTDTVWGLGCLPDNQKAVEKIYEIKNRDTSKPLILMSDKTENLLPYIKELPYKAKELINKYFPGALTLVCEKSEKTADYITSGKNTVGIRVPNNKLFQAICKEIPGHVLATTSANLSNKPSSISYEETINSVGGLVDFVFQDYGYICKGLESTVVSINNKDIKILRQGSVLLK